MVTKAQSVAIIAGVATLVAVAAIAAIIYFQYPISSHGSIRSVGCQIYGNPEQTAVISAIDWGSISPGDFSNVTIWVKNNGTAPINLALAASNYSPAAAQQYLNLSWNYANQTIASGAALPIELKLAASAQTKGFTEFSLDITITASG
jgi:hypothetical protein